MKKSKIFLGIILILIIVFAILLSQPKKSEDTIKIGVIIPLTGNGAVYGVWGKNALEIAKDEINEKGINNKKISLIYEDGKFDPSETVTSFYKLLNTQDIKYIITLGSSPAVAVSPLANNNKVIQMDFSATTTAYRSENDFTFRTAPQAEQFGIDAAQWLINNEHKEVSVLYINNDQGISISEAFKTEYKKLGGKILALEKFDQDGVDFRTTIIKSIFNNNYIFLIGHLKESGLIVRQMTELGYSNPILSHVFSIEGNTFLEAAGNFTSKIIYLAPDYTPEKNDKTIAYNNKYRSRYGEDSEYFGAFAYDALKVLSLAISQCNPIDTECVKEELFKIKKFEGLTGDISFDKFGDRIVDLSLKTIKNGEFVKYD